MPQSTATTADECVTASSSEKARSTHHGNVQRYARTSALLAIPELNCSSALFADSPQASAGEHHRTPRHTTARISTTAAKVAANVSETVITTHSSRLTHISIDYVRRPTGLRSIGESCLRRSFPSSAARLTDLPSSPLSRVQSNICERECCLHSSIQLSAVHCPSSHARSASPPPSDLTARPSSPRRTGNLRSRHRTGIHVLAA